LKSQNLRMSIPADNSFNNLVSELKEALSTPLPGSTAHDLLAPEHRKTLILQNPEMSKAFKSSVMILLYPDHKGNPYLVFIKRVEYKGVHSGQISFPGGKAEKTDANVIQTALRETEEEIGIASKDISVLGMLSELYVPPSNFIIYPIVGMLNDQPVFKPDNKEVAHIIEVPLSFFLNKQAIGNHSVSTYDGSQYLVPGFLVGTNLIWGATAMILSELILIIKSTSFGKK